MKTATKRIKRPTILQAAAVAGLGWLSRPLAGKAAVQQQAAAITARQVSRAPTAPDDPAWGTANPVSIPLSPQNLVLPRLEEAGAKGIIVRALFDDEQISFLLEWPDAHPDQDLETVMQYRDAAAIQFPRDPAMTGASFMMGHQGNAVTIYHWKSDWQFGRLLDVDEAYPNMYADWYQHSGAEAGEIPEASDYLTKGDKAYLTAAAAGNTLADPLIQEKIGPIQKMQAQGFGTLEPHATQDAKGSGLWQNGSWKIAMSFPRQQEAFTFREDTPVLVAFAVWDGSRQERNGQKAYSTWQEMRLTAAPAPTPLPQDQERTGILWPAVGGAAAVAAAAGAALIALRLRRPRQAAGPQEPQNR